MEERIVIHYVKRTQKDYTMSFKLQVVGEGGELSTKGALRKYGIQAHGTVLGWLRQFGNIDWQTQTPSVMKKNSWAKDHRVGAVLP